MRAVVFEGAGGNEVVRLAERADPVPGTHEVLVRVRWAGLNPADLLQRAGRYPPPPGSPADIPGLEVAGVVEGCGEGVLDWRPGDRVLGLVGGGGLAELVVVPERCLAAVPDGLGDREAAAVPEAFITAHDAIRTQAALVLGETLLVHGAGGGVGSAGVSIGVAAGARVLGTTRSPEAAALVERLGGEPLADDGFADAVLERTAGRGADVVLELVGAPHFPGNLEALAYKGRIMIVGTGAGSTTELSLGRLMGKRASLRGTHLRPRPLEEKALAVRALEHEVLPLLGSGRIPVIIDSVFPAEQIHSAFDRLAARGKAGKVLLEFG